jgi:hypothetical protein
MNELIERIDEDFLSSPVDGVCVLSKCDWEKIKEWLNNQYQEGFNKGYDEGHNDKEDEIGAAYMLGASGLQSEL